MQMRHQKKNTDPRSCVLDLNIPLLLQRYTLATCQDYLLPPDMTYKVKQIPARGRCIVTTASLHGGDMILEQAEPYAAVLYDDQVKRCHYSLEAAEARKCVRAALLK